MSLTSILAGTALAATTKLLFKAYLQDADPLIGDSLADIGKDAIKDALERTETEQALTIAAVKIVKQLAKSLEQTELPEPEREALARHLGHTLHECLTVGVLLAAGLDPEKVTHQLREAARRVPGAPKPPADQAFDKILRECARQLVAVADKLPK
ncbi:MAG TPA: hypothetical protein VH092_09970, partial [Urbifossiella sp.]|nr:hypothetical protein [Urbifossiella sp.]